MSAEKLNNPTGVPELPAQSGASAPVKYWPASQIAVSAGLSAKTIHRKARLEGWPVRMAKGLSVEYAPPLRFCPSSSATEEIGRRTITNPRRADALHAWLKFLALCELDRLQDAGAGVEEALETTAHDFSFSCSIASLRRWGAAYASEGFPGLLDQRPGRSGRKESPL